VNGTRVVLDTQVLLDLWVFVDAGVKPLLAALRKGCWIALHSADTEAEFVDVLSRPRFGLTAAARRQTLAHWHRLSVPVPQVRPSCWTCRDSHDQKFIDPACCAGARLLLTRDRALLAVDRRTGRDGLRIRTPLDALRVHPDPTAVPGSTWVRPDTP
jgi:predicted nucleic acid-binding protein